MSTTGLVAQAMGKNDTSQIDRVSLRSIQLGLLIGLAVLLLQTPITQLALSVFATDAKLTGHVQTYIDIRIWAAPAVLLRIAVVGFLIGTQRARTALFIELILNLSNAALNLWLVVGLGWGVAGVATGSLIAEWLAGLISIGILIRLRGLTILTQFVARRTWQIAAFIKLIIVNTFLFIRTLLLLAVFALIYRSSTGLGDTVLAANHVLLTFTTLISLGLDALAYAAEAHVGESIGQHSRERLSLYVRVTTQWAVLISIIYTLIFALFGHSIIALLTDQQAIQQTAGEQLFLFALLPLIAVWSYQLDGIFIGATRSADMMWAMLLSFIVFVPCLYGFISVFGNRGLWMAFLIFFLVRGVSLGLRYPALVKESLPN